MSRNVSDVLQIMRLALSRRNENDPDSNDTTLLRYLNNFVSLTMSDDVKLYEQFGTLSFTIDENNTTGVYEFPSGDTSILFSNTLIDALISIKNPEGSSVSWNRLLIYQNPGRFYNYWGFNNEDVLIPGFPTEMLYYGNQFVFRTIPEQEYLVNIYGYQINQDFSDAEQTIPFDYWMRYLAYGAAKNYASDFAFDAEARQRIEMGYQRERKLLLTRSYNQRKIQIGAPQF
jgi:hypothetical protein